MVLAAVLLAASALTGQGRPLLDVPYVAQTPELCGGAAASMVMRYWGTRDVAPEDFAELVVPSQRGIPAASLTAAVRGRGWLAGTGPDGRDEAWRQLESDVAHGRPVIALIEVAPGTFHYVVVVGLTADRIVWHDPARAPFRVTGRDAFDLAWEKARRWSLLLVPPPGPSSAASASRPLPPPEPARGGAATPCSGLVVRGVELANEGLTDEAEENLTAATRLCGGDPAPWRELAGLRFVEQDWREAARLATVAVTLDGGDAHARRILGASRFLLGDLPGALEAWTPLGEPRVDALSVSGAGRMTHPGVIDASGLATRQLLTANRLRLAERRVAGIPSVARARVTFEPVDGGLADVDIAVTERGVVPRGWLPLGVLGGRVVISDEIRMETAGALGQGERVSGMWRWRRERPRVALGAAFPSPRALPGVIGFDALWERQTYGLDSGAWREDRRRLVLRVSDWATHRLHWHVSAGRDRIGATPYAAIGAGAEFRMAGDRGALVGLVEHWRPSAPARPFSAFTGLSSWRTATAAHQRGLTVTTIVESVTGAAPLATWPGAGSGGRGRLLRAHPLIQDDVVRGAVFGRHLSATTAEWRQPVVAVMGQTIAVAAFLDGARAWQRAAGAGASRWYVDGGIGLRVATAGGTVRADVARSLRGPGLTWSAGWMAGWPQVY